MTIVQLFQRQGDTHIHYGGDHYDARDHGNISENTHTETGTMTDDRPKQIINASKKGKATANVNEGGDQSIDASEEGKVSFAINTRKVSKPLIALVAVLLVGVIGGGIWMAYAQFGTPSEQPTPAALPARAPAALPAPSN